jgi:exosortase
MPKGTLYIWILPVFALGLFFWQIHGFWDPDSHYYYGWIIPVMVAYLVWNRLGNAPDLEKPKFYLLLPAVLLAMGASFVRLLWEGMSFWYFLSWMQGIMLVGFCIIWLAAWGGWRWSRHFLFPLCFVLTAIPWLGSIEGPVVLWLTLMIAEVVTTALQLLGMPAVLDGALISIGSSVVEVAEACSGIRSLQLLLVMGLFLGDYGNFRLGKRIFLVACGLIAAFVQNAVRALALGWITAISGKEAYDKWHDPTGIITFVLGLAILMGIFFLLEKPARRKPREDLEERKRPPQFCLALSSLALVAFIAVEIFALVWMRISVENEFAGRELDRQALRELPEHQELPVDGVVSEILETFDISYGRYRHNGNRVSYYHIGWPEGHPIVVVNQHNPSVCMGYSAGLEQMGDRRIARLGEEFDGTSYETYIFEHPMSGKTLLVFRTTMIPEDYQNLSYKYVDQFQMLDSRLDKFKLAVNLFLNRIGEQRLSVRQLVLLSIEVDPEAISLDPAPLEFFIRHALQPTN